MYSKFYKSPRWYYYLLMIMSIIVSSIKHVGLRRGDIVVALKLCAGDSGGGRVLDVRWETCRRVAELIVHHHQRRRKPSSGEGAVIQLKVVTPITSTDASDGYQAADPNKVSTYTFIVYFCMWSSCVLTQKVWLRRKSR